MTAASGRPLRFLLILLLCWAAGRVAAAMPWSYPPMALAATRGASSRAVFAIAPARPATAAEAMAFTGGQGEAMRMGAGRALAAHRTFALAAMPGISLRAGAPETPAIDAPTPSPSGRGPLAAPFVPDAGGTVGRWALDTWLLWRDGGSGSGLPDAGRLGASQAGARLHYDLTPSGPGRLSVYARLTSALQSPAAPEAGLGLAYQPSRAIPVSVAVERRVALGRGGRDAFALVAVGGFGPARLPLGLRGEGYAQFGLVGLRRRDGFVDGKLSVLRPFAGERASAGLSVSGGAQPHLRRLDVGPEVQFRLTSGKTRSRLGAEWRHRIIGNARPGSGPAVTMVAGF